jgi:hypothetical protein
MEAAMSAIAFKMCEECGRHAYFYDINTGERVGGHSFSKAAALHALQKLFDDRRVNQMQFLGLQQAVYRSTLPGDEPAGMIELFVVNAQCNENLGIVLESEEEVLEDIHEMLRLFPDRSHSGVTWQ